MSSTSVPLTYEHIKQRLARRIEWEWKPGDRLPAVSVIAEKMGYGVSNTYRAMRALAREGVIVTRPGRGTFVAEAPVRQPPKPATPVRQQGQAFPSTTSARKRKIYLPVGEGRDEMVLRIVGSLTETLFDHDDANCVFHRGPGAFERHLDYRDLDVDAIVLIQPNAQTLQYRADQSVVMINTADQTPAALSRGYDLVTIDEVQGGVLAGEYLRGLGVTTACYVQNSGVRYPARLDALRLEGFEQGFGQSIPPENRLLCMGYGADHAAIAMPEFLKMNPRPQAVFTSCDEYAVGFLIAASTHGLIPRRDYQLVGFDGQGRGKTLALGPLTTVAVPAEAMGAQAAEFLISRLANPHLPPRRIALGCSLFEGATTSPVEGCP